MKKYLTIILTLLILSYQSGFGMELSGRSDSSVSKHQLKKLSYSLIMFGFVLGAFGTAFKFEKITLPPDPNGYSETKKEYNEVNYVMMSTGASCFIIGSLLLLNLGNDNSRSVGIYKINNDIGLMASIKF